MVRISHSRYRTRRYRRHMTQSCATFSSVGVPSLFRQYWYSTPAERSESRCSAVLRRTDSRADRTASGTWSGRPCSRAPRTEPRQRRRQARRHEAMAYSSCRKDKNEGPKASTRATLGDDNKVDAIEKPPAQTTREASADIRRHVENDGEHALPGGGAGQAAQCHNSRHETEIVVRLGARLRGAPSQARLGCRRLPR